MMKERILPLFITAAAALSMTACAGQEKAQDAVQEEVALAPLEEKKLSPAEEQAVAEPEPDSVGNMMVYPSGYEETGCLYGTNTLTFYFENEGVVGGDGLIYTYESPSGSAFSSVSTSSSNVVVSPMDDAGREYTGWDSGTKIDVCFSEVFEREKNYYVLLDPGAFRLNENLSKSITNASLITFRVKEYGFEPFSCEIENGGKFGADIRLGGDATAALCECLAVSKDGELRESSQSAAASTSDMSTDRTGTIIEAERFSEDGTFSPDLSGYEDSAVALKITFLNEKGASIDSSTFVLSVGNPSADDLAKVKASVYGYESLTPSDVVDVDDAQFTENDGPSDESTGISEAEAAAVIQDPLPAAVDRGASDSAGLSASAGVEASEANFKSASVSERIHREVDTALKGKGLSADEKGALVVETLNTLAKEGFVREGTPFYDSNSCSVTYVDANGHRESTKL